MLLQCWWRKRTPYILTPQYPHVVLQSTVVRIKMDVKMYFEIICLTYL